MKGTRVIFERIFIDQDLKKTLLLRSGLTLHGWRGLRKEARSKCHALSGVLLGLKFAIWKVLFEIFYDDTVQVNDFQLTLTSRL